MTADPQSGKPNANHTFTRCRPFTGTHGRLNHTPSRSQSLLTLWASEKQGRPRRTWPILDREGGARTRSRAADRDRALQLGVLDKGATSSQSCDKSKQLSFFAVPAIPSTTGGGRRRLLAWGFRGCIRATDARGAWRGRRRAYPAAHLHAVACPPSTLASLEGRSL